MRKYKRHIVSEIETVSSSVRTSVLDALNSVEEKISVFRSSVTFFYRFLGYAALRPLLKK